MSYLWWAVPFFIFVNHVIGAGVITFLDGHYYEGRLYAWWESAPEDMHPYRFTASVVQFLVVQLWVVLLGYHFYAQWKWWRHNDYT